MIDLDKENKELSNLININKDAHAFYNAAYQRVQNPSLRNIFLQLELLHREVSFSLQKQILANGGNPDVHETVFGQMNRFWGSFIANISNDVDETFISYLESAEDRCLNTMERTLESTDVRPETKSMLRKELHTLQRAYNYMKNLKKYLRVA